MNLEDIDKLIDETQLVIRNANDELLKWSKVKKDAEKAIDALEDTRVVFGGEPRRKVTHSRTTTRARNSFPVMNTILEILTESSGNWWGIDGLINALRDRGWNPDERYGLHELKVQVRKPADRLVEQGKILKQKLADGTVRFGVPASLAEAEGSFALAQ